MSFDVAADSYDRFMGRYSALLSSQLANLAGVRARQRVIDVGCGPGALTAELVARLGPEAIAAVDPSEPFVAAARARNPGVDVQTASADDLPYPDGGFDAALAQLVVHFMSDPVAGLAEMARVTRQGGVVAACVWDYGGGQSPLRVFWQAARELDAEVDDESGLPGTREGHLAELMVAAGLRDVEQATLTSSLEHQSFDDWWQPFTLGVGPAGHYAAALDAETAGRAARRVPKTAADRAVRRHGNGLGSPRPRVAAPRRLAPMAACPSCSRDVAEGFAFCPHCGAPLAPEDASQEERKLVTLLFADVTGSTRLSEELDAEVVRELMGAYFALAREEIEARGGTVEKFIGDAVMAVFGVPVAHEDDPERSLRAALGIRKRLVELNRQLQADGRPELQVRIGINSGEVVSTTTPRRGEVMVTGDAVNVAARVQQLAEPGQILVGQRTVAAAPSFRYRALGPRGIRGKTVDVEVSELIGEAIGAPERGTNLLRAPLVGREEELALLTSLVDRVAADRRPHLVTLYGQPGVGKSRLTAEFLATLARRPVPPRVVRGRCLSYGSGVTFWPLAEILKSEAEILDSDPPEEAVRKLDAMRDRLISTELATDPSRTTALLGFTVGIAVPGHDFSRMDPEQLRIGVVEAWRIFFSALATGGPVIAVIEDIHWADTALLDVLDDLGARVQGSVLFLCPARPDLTDRRPGWGGGRRSFSAVFLDPLEPEDTSRLVSLLLEVADLPPDLHARIVDRTGGNPFFVEEILRQMIDEGRILRDGEGWRAEAGLTAVQIPDTVQAVLAARIDLLGPDEKRALTGGCRGRSNLLAGAGRPLARRWAGARG